MANFLYRLKDDLYNSDIRRIHTPNIRASWGLQLRGFIDLSIVEKISFSLASNASAAINISCNLANRDIRRSILMSWESKIGKLRLSTFSTLPTDVVGCSWNSHVLRLTRLIVRSTRSCCSHVRLFCSLLSAKERGSWHIVDSAWHSDMKREKNPWYMVESAESRKIPIGYFFPIRRVASQLEVCCIQWRRTKLLDS